MCGIVGYLDKRGNPETPLGDILYRMLTSLSCRGPDSAGVAMYMTSQDEDWILRIKLGERGDFGEKGRTVAERLRTLVTLREYRVDAEYLRAVVAPSTDVSELVSKVEGLAPGLELLSAGERLEIAKQVGSPENLASSYNIRSFAATKR